MNIWILVGLASTFLAAAIIVRIWAGSEPQFFKILLTGLSLIPVLGPLAYFWIANWPSSSPPDLQSHYRGQQLQRELERRDANRREPKPKPGVWNGRSFFSDWLGNKNEKSLISALREPSRPIFIVLLVLGAMFLANWWLSVFLFLRSGWPWGYPTLSGGSMGTVLILAMLLIATPFYFWFAIKKWPE